MSCNFDGASVNMGKHNGVAKKVQEGVGDHLIKVHCVAHYLELTVVDVLKKEKKQAMVEVETPVKDIFKMYHQSSDVACQTFQMY